MKEFPLIALAIATSSCVGTQVAPSDGVTTSTAAQSKSAVVLVSDAKWEQLNPARGDKSPKAATLWGDRRGPGATGFLLRPTDGFRSPPHLHNVSYRGVVISGLIHNDDPSADEAWMPAGSFWTQPKGAVHITAATGRDTLAYIEIDEGPYLVLPVEEAFDSPELSINSMESEIVWAEPSNAGSLDASVAADGRVEAAFLWGNPQDAQPSGTLVKLPSGFDGTMQGKGSSLRAVVIRGQLEYGERVEGDAGTLDPGSYFSSEGESAHRLVCGAGSVCILYVRTEGTFEVVPERQTN